MSLILKTYRLAGNQLAVVKVETNHNLSPETKQKIAREFNFSETVFLHHDDPSQPPRIDIYTPVNEMDFAGHPVIGTGHVLFRQLLPGLSTPSKEDHETRTLVTKAGPVVIRYHRENHTVSAEIPHNVHIHSKAVSIDTLGKTQASLRGLSTKQDFPVVSIVKGVTYALVDFTDSPDMFTSVAGGPSPSVDLDDGWGPSFVGAMYYRRLNVDRSKEKTVVQNLRVRMVAIDLEDPACGSGSATVASFLALQDGMENGKYIFHLDQGSEIGRQSYITVEVVLNARGDGVESVLLAGQAAVTMSGSFYLPGP